MADTYFITIDGGTTNTRAALWKGEQIIAVSAREVGVRNTAITDSDSPLKLAVRECLSDVLAKASDLEKKPVTYGELKGIAASGMLTSNVGLVEIPHCTAPVTARELSRQIQSAALEDICPLPISFIPGVKNNISPITADNFDQMDMMRGEEVEAFAVWKEMNIQEASLIVLPGSHTKFVALDASGAITGCLTTINGELLSAITKNTILASSVNGQFVSEKDYDEELVKKGAALAKKTGLGRACFSGRILNTFVMKQPMQIANFLLGAVLQGDLDALSNSSALAVTPETHIIIAGKNPLRRALYDLLTASGSFHQVSCYEPKKDRPLSAIGAKMLYDMNF